MSYIISRINFGVRTSTPLSIKFGLPPEVRSMSLGRFKRSVSDLLLG